MATPETLTGSSIPKEIKEYLAEKNGLEEGLRQEYSIAALFTLDQLKDLLNTKDVIQDGRLVYIGSGIENGSAKVLVKKGSGYFYFNPNIVPGASETKIESLDKVAEHIFEDNGFGKKKSFPVGLRMFSNGKLSTATYPKLADVFGKINPDSNSLGGNKLYTSLMIAARTGCLESVKYFLKTGDKISNVENKAGRTALMFASGYGHPDVVEEILKDSGTNPNIRDKHNTSAIAYASA